jgi:dephospho-CoA kinase
MALQIYIGAQGCGKTRWVRCIATEQQIIRHSDILKEIVESEGLEWNHSNAHMVAIRLLSKDRLHFAKIILDEYRIGKGIVDGIKNPDEIDFLKKNSDNSKVIGFYCPRRERYERAKKRKREGYEIGQEEFMQRDTDEILDVGLNRALFRSDYFVLSNHFNNDGDEIALAAKNLLDHIRGGKTNVLSQNVQPKNDQSEQQPIEKKYIDIQSRINQLQRIYSRDMCCYPLFLEYFKLDEDVVRKYRNGEISIELLFI